MPIATLIELPTATTTPTATATPTPTPTFEPPIGQEFVLRAVADTFVTQGVDHQANSNWGRYGGMFIGFDYQEWLRQRILIRFDLSSLPPDTMILSATLKVRVKNCFRSSLGKCEHPMLVTVYNMAVPWGEYDATWNSVGGLYDREITTGWLVDGHSWSEFDVTTAAQMWQSGGPNYGVMLVGREIPPDDWWSIEAKEGGQAYAPQLVVRVLPMLR